MILLSSGGAQNVLPYKREEKIKTIIFVHGAFADQSAWGAVKPQLEARSYRVLTLELPGHGTDRTQIANISLATYVDAVGKIVNEQPDRITLVGHSMAGMVISGVAEKYPGKLERLVYVAAYQPHSGQSLQELAQTDKESLVGANMQAARIAPVSAPFDSEVAACLPLVSIRTRTHRSALLAELAFLLTKRARHRGG